MKESLFKYPHIVRFTPLLVAIGLCLVSCDRVPNADSQKNVPLSLKLHWIPDTHQLGFWTALDKGFYEKNGLNIAIYPGGMGANPIADVVGGTVDIGQVGGIEQVLLAKDEDLPVTAIAAIHRRTPHALISLETRPISSPSDFEGKKIAVAFGDTAEILLKAYMDKERIPKDSIQLLPFRFDLSPLINGDVDAVTGFSTGQPVTIEENGQKPAVLSYEAAGIRSYGYTLVVSEKAIATKKEALKAFLRASREGWEYAFENPEESIKLFEKRFSGSINPETSMKEIELIKHLMLGDDSRLAGWEIDATVVSEVKDLLVSYSDLDPLTETKTVFDNTLLEHD